MATDPAYRYLTPGARAIADAVGVSGLYKLSESLGGITIYLPSKGRIKPGHRLVDVLGMESTLALANADDGMYLTVPLCGQAVRAAHYDEIRHYRQTHTEEATARQFGITSRWVRRLMANSEIGEIPQMELFR